MAQLICQNLSLGYDGKEIVNNLDFSVNSGDYLCIIGENGSGKTTLMKTLLGLHKPMGGTIEMGDGLKQNEIGYLPQQTVVQKDFPASVYEIVLSGCQGRCGLRPFYNKDEKALALEAMQKMNILPLQKRCYRELSGGQQQRVLFARALCATGKLLLLDEPVSGLDPKVTLEMYQLIDALNKKDGITGDEGFSQATGTKVKIYNFLLATIIAVVIVLAMNLVGSLLISALVVFPALSAMRVCKNFKSVTICASIISVCCSFIGILASILAGTPVGSTIVVADLVVFGVFTLIGIMKDGIKK